MVHYSIKASLSGQASVDSMVTVRGWVRTRRDSKAGLSFIHIHDGSSFYPIQVVAASSLANYQDILRLTSGCSIEASGKLVESPAKGQPFEIQAEHITIVGWVDDPDTYPIQPKHHTLEYLREVAHLRPRTNTIGAVSRLRHVVANAIHKFFDMNDFFWLPAPIITISDCEGSGAMFRVSTLDLINLPYSKETKKIDFTKDFFGREAFLTVSGQLNAEAYALALSRVYTFGPTFRAENSNTARHLAEFWMVEPEVAFADLHDNADLAEAMLKFIFKTVLEKSQDDLAFFAERYQKDCITRLEALLNTKFERMSYTDAVHALEESSKNFEFPIRWGLDLQTEHERFLSEELIKAPVIVMDYPKDIKAFYMRLNDDEKTVAAMDVLVPGMGEIIGGSQREERIQFLDKRMDEIELDKSSYNWYRDLRRYGTVPHAGFGLGFERLLSYITGLTNIRDVTPFPRTPGHAEF